MQHGDLEEFHPERLIIVLEGVLADVTDEVETVGRWRKREQVIAYHIQWYDLPLKRLVTIGQRYPHYSVEIVTFRSEKLADMAAEFLDRAGIPYASIRYESFDDFVTLMRYQQDIRAVYDTELDRLDQYGQLGLAAVRSQDF